MGNIKMTEICKNCGRIEQQHESLEVGGRKYKSRCKKFESEKFKHTIVDAKVLNKKNFKKILKDGIEDKKGCGNVFRHGKQGQQICCTKRELCPMCKAQNHSQQENHSKGNSIFCQKKPADTFILSEKIFESDEQDLDTDIYNMSVIPTKDVKEFIKRLKEINFGCGCCSDHKGYRKIDKLAGDLK